MIEAAYRQLDAEWQKEADRIMWLSAVPVLCAAAAGILAAVMGPSIVLDAIQILAR